MIDYEEGDYRYQTDKDDQAMKNEDSNEIIRIAQDLNEKQELQINSDKLLIEELCYKNDIAIKAIKKAMLIKSLWMLDNVNIEHENEAKALHAMSKMFEKALSNKLGEQYRSCIKELERQLMQCKIENSQLIVLVANQEKEINDMKYKEDYH